MSAYLAGLATIPTLLALWLLVDAALSRSRQWGCYCGWWSDAEGGFSSGKARPRWIKAWPRFWWHWHVTRRRSGHPSREEAGR